MNTNTWFVIEIVGFSMAAALLVLAVILFFRLNVLIIIGELTGKRVEKEVKQIRNANINRVRRTNQPRQREDASVSIVNPLQKMKKNISVPKSSADTTMLSYDQTETMVLSNATSVLSNAGDTTLLDSNQQFTVIRSVIRIHTEETIS